MAVQRERKTGVISRAVSPRGQIGYVMGREGEQQVRREPMTESLWMACTSPWSMVEHLGDKASVRKRRLLACACIRRFWRVLNNERGRKAVETAERFADGLSDAAELAAAESDADPGPEITGGLDKLMRASSRAASPYPSDILFAVGCALDAADYRAFCDAIAAGERRLLGNPKEEEMVAQGALARDIFGNPFRSIPTVCPAWLAWNAGAVAKMAQSIYEIRAFEYLPFLADALEEAGCIDADILRHCRGSGEHVRGCWVIDLLLRNT